MRFVARKATNYAVVLVFHQILYLSHNIDHEQFVNAVGEMFGITIFSTGFSVSGDFFS